MIMSQNFYRRQFKDATYEDLIEERDRLIRFLQEYERLEKAGEPPGAQWTMHPRPVVRYQIYMDYLAELLLLMQERYIAEYVRGEKSLYQEKNRTM